jgi:hypothetical protein
MSLAVRAVDPALGYGDMDQIRSMLTTTGTLYAPSDEARLLELNLVLSDVLDGELGRTFRPPAVTPPEPPAPLDVALTFDDAGEVDAWMLVTPDSGAFDGLLGFESDVFHDATGSLVLDVVSSSAAVGDVSNYLATVGHYAVTPGTSYAVNAYVQPDSGAWQATAGLEWFDAGGASLGRASYAIGNQPTLEWSAAGGSFTAPPEAATVAVAIILTCVVPFVADRIWIDDVTLTEITPVAFAGFPGNAEVRLVYGKGGTMLVLPKPVWSIVEIAIGGTIAADTMVDGTALDDSAWRVGIEDHAGQIRALELPGGIGWNQPFSIMAYWCDEWKSEAVPADVSFAVERLVCETFKLENIPIVTEDGIVVPRFDPWLDPTVVKTITKYRLRDLVL